MILVSARNTFVQTYALSIACQQQSNTLQGKLLLPLHPIFAVAILNVQLWKVIFQCAILKFILQDLTNRSVERYNV